MSGDGRGIFHIKTGCGQITLVGDRLVFRGSDGLLLTRCTGSESAGLLAKCQLVLKSDSNKLVRYGRSFKLRVMHYSSGNVTLQIVVGKQPPLNITPEEFAALAGNLALVRQALARQR